MHNLSGWPLWQEGVTVRWSLTDWAVSLEVSQTSVSVGVSAGVDRVPQRTLQSAVRGMPGRHNSGSRVGVGGMGRGSHRQGADFPCSLMFSTWHILPASQTTMSYLSFHLQTSHNSGSYSWPPFPHLWTPCPQADSMGLSSSPFFSLHIWFIILLGTEGTC